MRSKTESVLSILRKKAPATVAIFNKGVDITVFIKFIEYIF